VTLYDPRPSADPSSKHPVGAIKRLDSGNAQILELSKGISRK